MTRDEQIAQVERDRQKREAGLLLFLLTLAERARLNVVRSIRVGAGWSAILRSVLLGDDSIDQRGGVPVLSRVMADSHSAGYARVAKLVNVELPELEPLAYTATARTQLDRIARSIEQRISTGLGGVATEDRIAADVQAVNDAFDSGGWTPEHSGSATAESSTAVLQAYGAGMRDGFRAEPVSAVTEALVFVNPLDARTTSICRVRAGVKVAPGDPWLERNYPPLHYGCRSMVLPVMRKVELTENPPDFPPPDPGFGSYSGMLVGGAYA